MKLEFLDNVSDGGNVNQVVTYQLVRLYDFNKLEAGKFKQLIQRTIIEERRPIDLSKADFIETINCNMILTIADTDIGIITSDDENFVCELTKREYQNMVNLLEPFCKKASGYQFLYDLDSPIEFLFSPEGKVLE